MKYFSTFSGVGGFELGIEYANRPNLRDRTKVLREDLPNIEEREKRFTCVGFSEIDKYASAVLKYHYPNIKNYGDIKTINWSDVPDFDLLVGGSPCQDLSVAGKRAGITGERSGLFAEFIRALQEKKPEYFIWENVKGALSSNKGWDFTEVQTQMANCGYELWWQVLNAKDFGVPQNRERIFVVGVRGERPREVFFERGANKKDIEQLNHPKHSNDRAHSDEGISPTLNTMQGGNRQPFIAALRGRYEEDGTIKQQLEPRKDGLSNTLTAVQKDNNIVNGTRIRRLTPIECERLMSWPDDWTQYGDFDGEVKEISDTQRYKMCGNGVVSEVVRYVVESLVDCA